MSTGPLRLRMAIVKLNKLQRMPENMSQLLPTKLTCQKISNCHPKIAGAKISDHLSSPSNHRQPLHLRTTRPPSIHRTTFGQPTIRFTPPLIHRTTEQIDPMATHYSTIGPAWLRFWAKHNLNGRDPIVLPKVDVAIKVQEISDLDEHNGRYHTIFVVLLDWVDPSLGRHLMSNQEELDAHVIDFTQHFIPKIELLDYVSGELEYLSGDANDPSTIFQPRIRPPDTAGECNHCTMT